jgi:inorganic pyrophosphatase
MRKFYYLTAVAILFFTTVIFPQGNGRDSCGVAAGLKAVDEYTLVADKNLWTEIEPLNPDGTINMVVEIPAGRTDKWEVKKDDGKLHWDMKNGEPRIVQYLGYPVNYGMIPKALLSKEMGGDGDPLDCLVLGAAMPRGAILKVKVIGVARLLDGGDRDDKILAVQESEHFGSVNNLKELNEKFPGVTTIIETWFLNYKGPGVFQSKGFGDVGEAKQLLTSAMKAFSERKSEE